jgi:hypothetical protein
VPSPSPTAIPTATPTLQPGFVQTALGLVWNGRDSEQLTVPAIPGLSPAIGSDGQTIQYAAIASNPYGLKAGAIGAYFNPLVSVSGKQVGGIALEAHIAAKYLAETPDSAGIPPILVPVDLRTAAGAVSVAAGTIRNANTGESFADIVVTTTGTVPVNDILPGKRALIVARNDTYGTGIFDSAEGSKTGDKWSWLRLNAPGVPVPSQYTNEFSLGQRIGETSGPVLIAYTTTGDFVDTELLALLLIGNSPASVFLQGN